MNTARTRNPKNGSRLRRGKSSSGTEKMRKDAAMLWYVQVDAAAQDEAEVDGGSGAPRLAMRGDEEEETKGKERK